MNKKFFYKLSIGIILLLLVAFFIFKLIKNRDPLNVNVNNINVDIKVERFDRDLLKVVNNDPYKVISELQNKYGYFFDLYNREIISIGNPDNSSYLLYLQTFLSDYAVIEANKAVNEVFKDFSEIENTIIDGFKHIKYYFRDKELPRLISFVAGFNQSIVVDENIIGIGLDKYLGAENKLYDMLAIPDYLRIEMMPDKIPVDVIYAWAQNEFPYTSDNNYLIEQMIYNGKILFFLDACYPKMEEEIKNKYTKKQLDFCYLYEREMWTTIVEQKLLFSTDILTIKKFTESAPYTSQFGPDSPPRTGNWLGLQIVRAYVKNNNISVPELMNENDMLKILNKSGYNPKYR